MKKLIIATAILLFGNQSFAQDWVYVGSDRDNNKWHIKSTYVKKEANDEGTGESIRIWTKQEFKKTTIRKARKLLTFYNVKKLQLIEADCSERKIKFVTTIFYDSKDKIIQTLTLQEYEQEWNDVVPDSIGEAMLNKICELFN